MKLQKFITKSDQETVNLGTNLASKLSGGELILLTGDLGGGKTHFTKGVAAGLGVTETVVSPTFTIERIYSTSCHSREGGNLELHHFDLYRTIEDREIELEIEDLVKDNKNVVVVEWPENISKLNNLDAISISFKYIDENIREITVEGLDK
jgi:tRNA threonylcarbamoyladenosine biosynthesis protein TsaE